MSCVVGLVTPDGVIMAADSGSFDDDGYEIVKTRKVFQRGSVLIGVAGSWRLNQLLQFSFKPPRRKPRQEIMDYMVTSFVQTCRECFVAGSFENTEDDPSDFLVAIDGRLFRIDYGFQVSEPACGFDAIGVGSESAKGALHAQQIFGSRNKINWEPRTRVLDALTVSEKISHKVKKPFVVETLLKKTRAENPG